jgi:hypothetical protein
MDKKTEHFGVYITTAAPLTFASDVARAVGLYLNRHEGSRVCYTDTNRPTLSIEVYQISGEPMSVAAVDPAGETVTG